MIQNVDAAGVRIDKNNSSFNDIRATSEMKHLIKPDATIANSANWPTLESYIAAEATDNYILGHLSQYIIVTYHAGDINSAT
jgi:hypothetical protein